MKTLVHFKQQQLQGFIDELIEINALYGSRSYVMNDRLINHLVRIQAYYKQVGESTDESKVSNLKIYLDTAFAGFDPVKKEKIRSARREIVHMAVFHSLTELQFILTNSLQEAQGILNRATELLSQIVLSAIQAKLLGEDEIDQADSIDKIQVIWTTLRNVDQFKVMDQKLRLEVLPQDIYLLINKIFDRIKITDYDS